MLFFTIEFANQWAWFLMVIPLLMLLFYIFFYKKTYAFTTFSYSSNQNSKDIKVVLKPYLPILPILATIFLIIAIARPQTQWSKNNSYTKGIDIVLAMDVSTSMLERDFSPNRLEASKKVAANFISKRPNDRIGLVVFAGESYTQCPPTIDHNIVMKQLSEIKNGVIEDGTAIGMGLATAVRSLKQSDAKSKVVVLLTDGVNTAGIIDPNTSIEIAKALKTKVYCIGVGTPKNNILGIDEPLMRRIASQTGGVYFKAGNNQRLEEIYEEINKLETTEIEVNNLQRKSEDFLIWGVLAGLMMLFYFIGKYTWLRSIND